MTGATNVALVALNDKVAEHFASIQDTATGTSTFFEATSKGLVEFTAQGAPSAPSPSYLRAFASPHWLNSVGEIYEVSPELFHFVASAKLQFLNLLDKHIKHELSIVGSGNDLRYHSVSLLTLVYIKTLLASHVQNLTDIIGILRNRRSLDWPQIEDSGTAEKAAVLLLADFDHLLQRADTLTRECEQGMTTLANISVLDESRRSANMALRTEINRTGYDLHSTFIRLLALGNEFQGVG